MNKKYKVKALFQETKRRRTITFIARNKEDAIELLRNSGFIEPFEIEEEQSEPPTPAQLKFIKDLNITIPTDATKEDVAHSALRGWGTLRQA